MDFSNGAGQTSQSELIPNGQLAFVVIEVVGVKSSQSGGQYIDMVLTVDDGQPHARRKIFEKIGDPEHAGNTDKYRQMGQAAIARILECCNNAGPANPGGYQLDSYERLTGARVPIKIGVENGKDGRDDKNRVADWLTPNPKSEAAYKSLQLLMAGTYNAKAATAPAATMGGFGAPTTVTNGQPALGFGTTPPPAQGGFGAVAATPPASGGFGGQAGAAPGFQAAPLAGGSASPAGGLAPSAGGFSSATGFAQPQGATKYPSDAPGGWLAQANAK